MDVQSKSFFSSSSSSSSSIPFLKLRSRTRTRTSRGLRLVDNAQGIFPGKGAIGLGVAHGIVIEIELVAVMDDVGSRRNRHQPFPAIGHQLRRAHRVKLCAHEDLWADA